ncbi:MAG: hypothetical protein KDC33_12200, partial [Thermoleophilia bacterium]|nr:hypothetical protein [Thermoleophilia bacterium]
RVPLTPGPGTQLALTVDPEGGAAWLAQVGLIVRRPAVRMDRPARAGRRVALSGRVAGCPVRAVSVRLAGRVVTARVRGGRFRVAVRGARPGVALVTTSPTRACDAARARVRVAARLSR